MEKYGRFKGRIIAVEPDTNGNILNVAEISMKYVAVAKFLLNLYEYLTDYGRYTQIYNIDGIKVKLENNAYYNARWIYNLGESKYKQYITEFNKLHNWWQELIEDKAKWKKLFEHEKEKNEVTVLTEELINKYIEEKDIDDTETKSILAGIAKIINNQEHIPHPRKVISTTEEEVFRWLYDDVRAQLEIDKIEIMSDVDILKTMMHLYMIRAWKELLVLGETKFYIKVFSIDGIGSKIKQFLAKYFFGDEDYRLTDSLSARVIANVINLEAVGHLNPPY